MASSEQDKKLLGRPLTGFSQQPEWSQKEIVKQILGDQRDA